MLCALISILGKLGSDDVFLFKMGDDSGIRVKVSKYGGIIQSFFVTDLHGTEKDIVGKDYTMCV